MGMFDEVHARCPRCNDRATFQTKSGPCRLNEYDVADAPEDVMRDVNRHAPQPCDRCGALLSVDPAARTVTMVESEAAK